MTNNFLSINIVTSGPLFEPAKMEKAVNQALLNAGAFLLTELVMLANNGKNADNQPLQPYSVWYQAIRQMKGLNTRPNFQFTSSMLNSLTILNKNDKSFSIGVVGVDVNGMSNALKLQKVQERKNYYLLRATNYLAKKTADWFQSQLIDILSRS